MAADQPKIPDHYKTLGVPQNASDQQIKDAYRQISRDLHPDINSKAGAEEALKEVNVAYEALGRGRSESSEKFSQVRENYDAIYNSYIREGGTSGASGPPPVKITGALPGGAVLKGAASEAVKRRAAGVVGKKTAAWAAKKGIGKALGGAVGSVATPIGSFVGMLVGDLVVNGLTKAKDVTLGMIIGIGSIMSTAAGAVGAGFGAIGTTLLATVLGIPLLLALIIFIINAGAYVTPPGGDVITIIDDVQIEGELTCLQFQGNWTQQDLATEAQVAKIIGRSQKYANDLCAGGPITLIKTPQAGVCPNGNVCTPGTTCPLPGGGTTNCILYGGYIEGPRTIQIFPAGIGSVGNALYTLSHELGHVYDRAYDIDVDFHRTVPSTEKDNCTYPIPSGRSYPTENFAENIALYIAGPSPVSGYRSFTCLGGTLKTVRPVTWQFLRDNVFLDELDW
ncbi:MAG: hypothetical protein COU68_01725 [Candidatus Pacebacteria bacterium CG10_big_fil_rev_8_21_14_0_10_45_6]|nr:MAG: hypothetical protein COU68_01725 [Candidatus Pacebacteria bacterium CG10_big_fil_rev_8_21_14_0_10_45_6]